MNKLPKPSTRILYILFLVIAICYMLINPYIVINAIKTSLSTFTTIVIPSLFPFILCSQMLIMLGGAKIIGRPLVLITRFLNLEDSVAGAYATSLFGGYPAGAASIGLLHETGEIRGNLVSMLLCSNCGPMFAIGTVGAVMLGSYKAGIVILISHIVGGLIATILFAKFSLTTVAKPKPIRRQNNHTEIDNDIFAVLDKSIIRTCIIMGKIFGFLACFKLLGDIVFANVSINVTIDDVSIFEVAFRGFLEIMDGCISASSLSFYIAVPIVCFIVSFGGLSAVFQSASVSRNVPYDKKWFIIGKLMHGVISALLCTILIRIVNISVPVYAQKEVGPIIHQSYPTPLYIFILIAIIIFYMFIRLSVRPTYKR